ncbi:hypothetical protein ACWDA9_32775 [Streptomyces sp. NPDC001193]
MTAMLCQLHAADPEQPLPAGRGQLYRDFTELLYRHRHRVGAPDVLPRTAAILPPYRAGALTAAEEALGRLPAMIAHLAAERLTGSRVPAIDFLSSHPDARRPPHVPEGDWRVFLDTAARRSGLLVPRGGDLVFLHQTLLEHLAARHLMSDPRRGQRALGRAFHPYSRKKRGPVPFSVYLPDAPRGIKPRPWFLPHCRPPADLSTTAFLLDAAHEARLTLRRSPLKKLASRGGLPGWRFIAALAAMGTPLPDDVVVSVAESLHAVTAPSQGNRYRGQAAEALARLGDPRGPDRLHDLTSEPDLSDSDRLKAAEALVQHGDPRGTVVLLAIARDARSDSDVRTRAAAVAARTGDPLAADVLYALALDPEIVDQDRIETAELAAATGDPRALDLLHTLTFDPTVRDELRAKAAALLASSGDLRGAERLRTLGHSRDVTWLGRLAAGEALVGLDRHEAAEVFHLLASAQAKFPVMSPFAHSVRVDAAWRLSEFGDPRASALLLSISRDTSVGPFPRVYAAGLLAALGESSAADQLHMLAKASEIAAEARFRAAVALFGLGDLRAAPMLHLLAVLPELPDHLKIRAAWHLVQLGDAQAAELLRTLNTLVAPGPFDGHRQCVLQLLAQLGDPYASKAVPRIRKHEPNRAQRILRLLVFQEPYRVRAKRGEEVGPPAADGSTHSDHGWPHPG